MIKRRILVIEDHQMIREGIRYMLSEPKNNISYEIEDCINGVDGLKKAISKNFDVIIVDFQLPLMDGLETTKKIISQKPESKILVLSNYDEFYYIQTIIQAGAKGYVLKNIDPKELILAIETVYQGKNFYSQDIAQKIITKPYNLKPSIHGLTDREIEVIKLIGDEKTNEEIAEILSLSKRTVDTHRQRILDKLNVKNTVGLIKFAIQEGIIKSNT